MHGARAYFKKTDLMVVVLVLLVSALSATFLILNHTDNSKPEAAEIRVNTKLINTINLSQVSEPYTITVEGNLPVTLEISKDGVRFTESPCTDKLCVHSGLIESNESAACLPAGVSVTVKGEKTPEVDAVVG